MSLPTPATGARRANKIKHFRVQSVATVANVRDTTTARGSKSALNGPKSLRMVIGVAKKSNETLTIGDSQNRPYGNPSMEDDALSRRPRCGWCGWCGRFPHSHHFKELNIEKERGER